MHQPKPDRVGNKVRRRQVQVAVVDGTVEISVGEELIRVHPIRHDRTRQHGALAAVLDVLGVDDVEVNLVCDPSRTIHRVSGAARRQLGLL